MRKTLPYDVYKPMKYAVAKSQEILDDALESPDYGIELKVDGASYILAKDLDGEPHLYGSRISKKTGLPIDKIDNVPHIQDFIEQFFPCGSQLIAEITYLYDWSSGSPVKQEKSKSSFVNSIMLCDPPKAQFRQYEQTMPCQVYVFDILFWDNQPIYHLDFIDRYKKIQTIFSECDFTDYEWLSISELITENKKETIIKWLAEGEEGGVLKRLTSNGRVSAAHALTDLSSTAHRPMHTTYKIKQVDTVDVVILGVNYPTKEYTGSDSANAQYKDENGNPVNRLYALGMINSFDIGVYSLGKPIVIGTVASGLNDALRLLAAQNPKDYIGKVIECDCMSKDVSARTLRHPRFIAFRPDKNAEDCTMETIF